MSDINLKDCPFCGGKAYFGTYDMYSHVELYVYCNMCEVSTVSLYFTWYTEDEKKQQLAENWNTRC